MACCRTALLVRLTVGIALYCALYLLPVSGSDEPPLASSQQDVFLVGKQRRALRSRLEGTKANTRHGMTASSLRTARRATVAAVGPTAASVVAEAACGTGWLYCNSGSRRRRSRSTSISTINTGSSSSSSIDGDAKAGCDCGRGRRALSLFAPAVAPCAHTSALFVVSNDGPVAPSPPPWAKTTRNTIALPAAAAAAVAAATPTPTPTPLLAAERARCRPLVRSPPLRFDIPKPGKIELQAANSRATGLGSSSQTAGSESPSTSEMMCGGGGGGAGGMTSSFTWLPSVNSTMDEVKTLIVNQEGSSEKRVFAVAAREQLRGRGTKGRAWIGLPGNVFLTVAIPLDRVPVPLSLIPLRVGTLIAPEIKRRLPRHHHEEPSSSLSSSPAAGPVSEQPRVSLKWPNDVLLGGSKVAGVLIEAELPFLLVGIGVNVRHKPEVPQQGPDRGRQATCLGDFGADSTDEAVRELSAALTEKLCSWASETDSADTALSEFSRWVDWSLPLEIRDGGRAVTPVGVAPDGRLRVVDPASGNEELLSTEYLL